MRPVWLPAVVLVLAGCGGDGGSDGSPGPVESVVTHRADPATVAGAGTILSHPSLDGDPEALVVATHVLNPGGSATLVRNPHPIGVRYVLFRGRWEIFNVDGAAMVAGAAFHVTVLTNAEGLRHLAIPENTSGNVTELSHAALNDDPTACPLVTHDSGAPDSPSYTVNDANVGLYYLGGRWRVFNEGGESVPFGAAFVVAFDPGTRPCFTHDATPGTLAGPGDQWTLLSHPSLDGNPAAIVSVSPHWNPPGETSVYDDHPIGVVYDVAAGRWAVVNVDGAPMPPGASFNVWVR